MQNKTDKVKQNLKQGAEKTDSSQDISIAYYQNELPVTEPQGPQHVQ